jgi:hypothetical protein
VIGSNFRGSNSVTEIPPVRKALAAGVWKKGIYRRKALPRGNGKIGMAVIWMRLPYDELHAEGAEAAVGCQCGQAYLYRIAGMIIKMYGISFPAFLTVAEFPVPGYDVSEGLVDKSIGIGLGKGHDGVIVIIIKGGLTTRPGHDNTGGVLALGP